MAAFSLELDELASLRARIEALLDAVRPNATASYTAWALGRFGETLGRALAATALRRAREGPRLPRWTLGQEAMVEAFRDLGRELVAAPPTEARAFVDALQSLVPVRPDVRVRDVLEGPPGSVELVPDDLDPSAPLVVHFHGGGYCFGAPRTYAGHLARLAHAARCRVLLPRYRLAPEAGFPAALEDACAAMSRVLARTDPARVVVTGDSAGGGLALSCLLARRAAGQPMPAGVVLSSPWVDLAAAPPDGGLADWASPAFLAHFAALFLGEVSPEDPAVSPMRAELAGLPPLRIQVGGAELFRRQNETLVARARDAGVDARLEVWPGMVHAFWALGPLFPADDALAQVVRWVSRFRG